MSCPIKQEISDHCSGRCAVGINRDPDPVRTIACLPARNTELHSMSDGDDAAVDRVQERAGIDDIVRDDQIAGADFCHCRCARQLLATTQPIGIVHLNDVSVTH